MRSAGSRSSSPGEEGGSGGSQSPPPCSHRLPDREREYDTESLDRLELEAEDEDEHASGRSQDENELEDMDREAEEAFPQAKLDAMIKDLQERGVQGWIQSNVLGTAFDVRLFLHRIGIILPRAYRRADCDPMVLFKILTTALRGLMRRRERLAQYNTPADAVSLIRRARNIVVLTGAGISVSCGIPDFRSRDGIYAQLEAKHELDEPEDMFTLDVFLHNPAIFYDFAHSIFPSNFAPSPSHRFIKLLQDKRKLLRNYTQNIDTLEHAAGITRTLQCHGSFASATCTDKACGHSVRGSEIKGHIFRKEVPPCPACAERKAQRKADREKKGAKKRKGNAGGSIWRSSDEDDDGEDEQLPGMGVLKPDITFFGEKLASSFEASVLADRGVADLLIVMGTSLQVAPVTELLTHMPHRIPVLLINRTPILHFQTDIMLLGSSDEIVAWLCRELGEADAEGDEDGAWDLPQPQPVQAVVGTDSVAQAQRESDGDGQEEGKPPASAEKAQAPREPTRWGESTYIWTWPDADLEQLEVLAARRRAQEEKEEEADAEEGNASADAQDHKNRCSAA